MPTKYDYKHDPTYKSPAIVAKCIEELSGDQIYRLADKNLDCIRPVKDLNIDKGGKGATCKVSFDQNKIEPDENGEKKDFRPSCTFSPLAYFFPTKSYKAPVMEDFVKSLICKTTFEIRPYTDDQRINDPPMLKIRFTGSTKVGVDGHSGLHMMKCIETLSAYEKKFQAAAIKGEGINATLGNRIKEKIDAIAPEGMQVMPFFQSNITEFTPDDKKDSVTYKSITLFGNMSPVELKKGEKHPQFGDKEYVIDNSVDLVKSVRSKQDTEYDSTKSEQARQFFVYTHRKGSGDKGDGDFVESQLTPSKWKTLSIPLINYGGYHCKFISKDIDPRDYLYIKGLKRAIMAKDREADLRKAISEAQSKGMLDGYTIEKTKQIFNTYDGAISLKFNIKEINVVTDVKREYSGKKLTRKPEDHEESGPV